MYEVNLKIKVSKTSEQLFLHSLTHGLAAINQKPLAIGAKHVSYLVLKRKTSVKFIAIWRKV